MTTDLLIVNYNTRFLLERLLDTLHVDYKPDVWKIYIADNGSTDDTKEWLANNRSCYQIEAVVLNQNIGYSAAINALSNYSESEYLCAVNADTWFSTKHVQQVQKSFEDSPNAAVIGPKQLDEKNLIRHGGIFWDGVSNPKHRGWSELDSDDSLFKDKIACWTVSGSIYYVRRDCWDAMTNYPPYRELYPMAQGAFLPTPMYFEETFCSQLAHHMGYDVLYDGTVETAGHTWNASTGTKHDDNLRNMWQISRGLYMETCDRLGIKHECLV